MVGREANKEAFQTLDVVKMFLLFRKFGRSWLSDVMWFLVVR